MKILSNLLPLLVLMWSHCYSLTENKAKYDIKKRQVLDKSRIIDDYILPEARGQSNSKFQIDRAATIPTTDITRADICPASVDIAPCICSVDVYNKIDLDCTLVESEERLASVFQQEFPVKNIQEFYMANNTAIRILQNFSNGVTFESVRLSPGPFALEQVTDLFILDHKDTLASINIANSQLTSENFPFELLSQTEKLDFLRISDSLLTWIPPITAPNLSELYIDFEFTETLEAGTFPIHEWTTTMFIGYNKIASIEPGSFFFVDGNSASSSEGVYIVLDYNELQFLQAGTFTVRRAPVELRIFSNPITSVEPGTFVLLDAESSGSDNLYIDLGYNEIQFLYTGTFPFWNGPVELYVYSNPLTYIEPGTFVLPERRDSLSIRLYMSNNRLRSFDEDVFGELMPFVENLSIYGNPFSCDCSIAWMVLNVEFMSKVDDIAKCANGTYLHDLNPADYVESC